MSSNPVVPSREDCPLLAIAIDGAQSTGKTTVFNHLRTVLNGSAAFVPEASRIIAGRFGVLTASDWPGLLADPTRLQGFFEAEEVWQRSAEAAGSTFIVDSSLYLVRAYREYFQIPPRSSRPDYPEYDLILYCPVGDIATEDGFRFLRGRSDIDRLYTNILQTHHRGEVVELPLGESRFLRAESIVLTYLQQHGLPSPIDHGPL